MMRLLSMFFLFTFSTAAWAQDLVFQGRVDLGRDLSSFETTPPVKGTLYLLSGSASAIRIVSQDPFVAEVDFIQGEWKDDTQLVSHGTLLRFEGEAWAKRVAVKKPRQGSDEMVYPYRKFQVAALATADGFRAVALTLLF